MVWREAVGENTSEDGGHIYARVCCNPPPTPHPPALALLHTAPLTLSSVTPLLFHQSIFTFGILIRGYLKSGAILSICPLTNKKKKMYLMDEQNKYQNKSVWFHFI